MLFCFFFVIFNLKQLYIFSGKYYLVDSGYPNEYGFLGPYRGQRYHLQEFRRRGQPQTREEIFNRMHSSLRCVIERTFGVWKKRWRILQNMPSFNYKEQVRIVVASMAIHNYIRRTSMHDVAFMEFDRHPDFVPDDFLTDVAPHSQSQGHHRPSRMDYVRDGIAASLMTQL
jgi:hypothetical protein